MAADELSADEQRAVELLRSAEYSVEYWPRRLSAWQVTFGLSEGLGPSLRQALKHCFWFSKPLSSAKPGNPAWRARQAGIESMKRLDVVNAGEPPANAANAPRKR
jgi:hypothetical protein